MDRYVADKQARGSLTGQDVKLQTEVADAYHRALEREALTLTGRIEATGQLARLMGAADLSQLSDAELEELIAKLDVTRTGPPKPTVVGGSQRATREPKAPRR
jgi:hypothetical protein